MKGEGAWDTAKLKLGPDCPYFENGHEFVAVEWRGEPGDSVVSSIKGGWEVAYLRERSCGPVNPFKPPTGAVPAPKLSPSTKSGRIDVIISDYQRDVGGLIGKGENFKIN